jgi:hypothetical protein
MTCLVDSSNYFVDSDGCSVRDGDSEWPFVIDCANGDAHIRVADCDYVLRPLGWRQKRNLARYAHLGEQFLQTQFLRISLDDPQRDLPESTNERDVLSALARWLNAPDGNFGLPLDKQLLASVTLDICRDMQLPPSTFDALDASEVEMLWQAARASKPPRAELKNAQDSISKASAAMNRIVIVPDSGSDTRSDGDLGFEEKTLAADAEIFAGDPVKFEESANVNNADIAHAGAIRPKQKYSPNTLKRVITRTHSPHSNLASKKIPPATGNRFRFDFSRDYQKSDHTQSISLDTENAPDTGDSEISEMPSKAQINRATVLSLPIVDSRADSQPMSLQTVFDSVGNSTPVAIARPSGLQIVASTLEPVTHLPQQNLLSLDTSEQLFAEFADSLEEAAKAAGIDLEN